MELKTERSIREALSEVHRELCVRERCFDKWIKDGKMTDVDAQDRFDRMASAYRYLTDFAAIIEKRSKKEDNTAANIVPMPVTSSGDMTNSAQAV